MSVNLDNDIELSKFLSSVLRHAPHSIGLVLDKQGWADIDSLASKSGLRLSRQDIVRLAATSDKKRFDLSDDGQRVRANQGHSLPIELGLVPAKPPAILYHGTAARFLEAIYTDGLKPQQRTHVHLTESKETALETGARYGKPALLHVDAQSLHAAGVTFFRTKNDVWLVTHVPPDAICQESETDPQMK